MRKLLACLGIIFFVTACDQASKWDRPAVAEISSPAASGASYPFTATGAGGDAVMLSWLEPDNEGGAESTKLMWASFDGEGWSPPEVIHRGDRFFVNWADFPSLAVLQGTPVAAHWLQAVPGGTYAYHVNMAFRSESGDWSAPFTPHADRSATEHGFVSMVPLGPDRVFALWLDGYRTQGGSPGGSSHDAHAGDGGPGAAMTLRSVMIQRDGSLGEELEVDGAVCDCCQTSAARSGNRIIAVYRNRTAGEIRDIYRAVYDLDEGRWSEPAALSHEGWEIAGCPVNGPQVAAFDDTVIATWFSAAEDRPRSYVAVSHDGGLAFGEPELLDSGASIGRVGIAFNRDGAALLTWISSGEEASVVRGRLWSEAGLQDPFIIGQIDGSRASGFPRSAGLGGGFLVAWTEPVAQPELESRIRAFLVSSPGGH